MNNTQKLGFFFLALLTMICFATGSVMMAEDHAALAGGLFVLAFVIVFSGFILKRKITGGRRNR